ncbi:MAG: nickel pincer cofactor biosynthesis protein LarB [Bacillota bacterium]
MDVKSLKALLAGVAEGRIDVAEAVRALRDLPYENLGYARLDHHRALRTGFPEVIFCQGKTPSQVAQIFARLAAKSPVVLATRAGEQVFACVKRAVAGAKYHPAARCITLQKEPAETPAGPPVAVLSAGTADQPVAEESRIALSLMGHPVRALYDVGVSGIHRLFDHLETINECAVVIVVAGMEGALPSVVAGLTPRPVIAVPTSVGYGSSFNGLAALLAMLNSCAPGIGVVNIDNGYGAAALADAIVRTGRERE